MNRYKTTLIFPLFALFIALTVGNSIASVPSLKFPLFFDDLSKDHIGGLPGQWRLSNAGGEYGSIEVIAAPELNSGKAIKVAVNPHEESKNVSMRGPLWDRPGDHSTVVIDHKIRWIEGDAMYNYVVQSTNRLIWLINSSGHLVYQAGDSGSESVPVDEGWNHIRLVADRELNAVYVFINDLDTPAIGPLPFTRPMDDWKDARLIFSHWTHAKQRREIHYGEFKVWSVPSMGDIVSNENEPTNTGDNDHPNHPIGVDSMLAEQWEASLRPADGAKTVHAEHAPSIPFYQAIPIAKGSLFPDQLSLARGGLKHTSGQRIPAVMSPSSLWSDGSIRWLGVDGIWPANLPFGKGPGEKVTLLMDDTESIHRTDQAQLSAQTVVHSLRVRDDRVHLLGERGETVATLTPRASYIEITEPKQILPDSIPDDERQYAWAEPLDVLNPSGETHPMALRIREQAIERDHDLFTIYLLRGDGGETRPGSGLEWQLRVRVYQSSPVVRLQMTWALHWDAEQYALTQAEWVAEFMDPLVEAVVPGVTTPFNLTKASVRKQSDPTGRHMTIYDDKSVIKSDWPDPMWDLSVVKASGPVETPPFIGIGTPRFTRLGPNHMTFSKDSIVFASWNEHSGMGLDLRVTAEVNEFGMSSPDVATNGAGIMQTLETSLVWGESVEVAKSLAQLESRRDTLWFPSRDDMVSSGSLGPWASYALDRNADYLEDVNAEIHFVIASADRWRWNGWANYGDIRTNFSRTSNPERGLLPDRWALHGRYGWRKAAAQPYLGMWFNALTMDDRDVALFAMDYALHVANIDVIHGSYFGPSSPNSGGAHRRNKDHWSGSPQMQYTFSTGLYLSQWLTGHERLSDTLAEIREYARHQGNSGSAAAGSAWIHRYTETHDPADLSLAKHLLEQSALSWERRGLGSSPPADTWGNPDPHTKLTGLAALYQNNFRLPLDGIPILIEFYEATGERTYLEAILTTLKAHGIPDNLNAALSNYHGLAYLLASGYTEDDIGVHIVDSARSQVERLIARSQSIYPPKDQWNYDSLLSAALRGSSMETTAVGWRAKNAPVVLKEFGPHPIEIRSLSPREGARVSGEIPINLEIEDPSQIGGIEQVKVETKEDVLYAGQVFPKHETLFLDTKQLEDGKHVMTITLDHQQFGVLRRTVSFHVNNEWKLVQNMTPPVSQGWFGAVDFLQTVNRTEGWTYDTGRSDQFFGDPERLVRADDTEEFLVWNTPGLKSVAITVYVRRGTHLEKGLILAVSESGDEWRELPYDVHVESGDDIEQWDRVSIIHDTDADAHFFRITLTERLAHEDVQIGEVVLTGYRDSEQE